MTIDVQAMNEDTATIAKAEKQVQFDEHVTEIFRELENPLLPTWKRDALHAELRTSCRLQGYGDDVDSGGVMHRPLGATPAGFDAQLAEIDAALQALPSYEQEKRHELIATKLKLFEDLKQ